MMEPVILRLVSVDKVGIAFPKDSTVSEFDRTLLSAKRAVKAIVNWGDVPEHRKRARLEVLAFVADTLNLCVSGQRQHQPDFTGASARMNESIRRMFWMHQVRRQMGESKIEFDVNHPYASLRWLKHMHMLLDDPHPSTERRTLDFLESWRTAIK